MNVTLEQLGPIIGPLLLIMATLASCVLVTLRILEKRSEKKNGGSSTTQKIECKPGHAKVCQENTKAINTLEVTSEFVAKDISEIKTTMGNIWEKINGA